MQDKINFMVSKGFSSQGDIYCVGGGNTYLIKDRLKELGFRFSDMFGWYSDTKLPVPAPYQLFHFTFDELFQWEEHHGRGFPYSDTKQKLKAISQVVRSESEYIGAVGQKIIDLPVELLKIYHYDSNKRLYIFKNNENKIIWRTNTLPIVSANSVMLLTGTVAAHETYRNEKVTRFTRCSLQSDNKNTSIYFL